MSVLGAAQPPTTESSPLIFLDPPGWPRPKGYSNGVMGSGRFVLTGGQIGWDAEGRFAEGLVAQIRQALANIVEVVAVAGGRPESIARLTWYVTDMEAYRGSMPELGPVYREIMGRHFPAMAVVAVTALVELEALVEIEATAILPD
jgi:enamine deaminase RidA (YjgF/YER057c/UK114 family)